MAKNEKNHNHSAQKSESLIEGEINLNFSGVGYLRVPEENKDLDQDIEIPTENLNTALNKDLVRVKTVGKSNRGRIQGEVLEIIDRNKTGFVGAIQNTPDGVLLDADDPRMYTEILLTNTEKFERLEDGVKAYATIYDWSGVNKKPRGEIQKILGKKGEHDVEMNSIILEHGFRVDFSKEVTEEAKKIQKEAPEGIRKEAESRKDMRQTKTFTIDPWDAKDFDDGLSIKKVANDGSEETLYEVGIHIADVSHYVKPESELDKEARKRGFSVYLVDRTIPMLPEELSNDVCSLNPEEDKLAFSAVFKITESGQVTDRWFGRTIINSDKRFTYEEAQESIDNDGLFHQDLSVLNKIAKKLGMDRFANGAIDFETDEVEIELDENNEPKKIYKKERLDTHKLVEEFMLLANREVARFISEKQKNINGKFIYRVHDEPNPEKIESLVLFADALGHPLDIKQNGSITSKNLNDLLRDIKDEPGEDMLKTAAIRSMAKAVYSTKNIGHFGLAFKYYTHFTSPIRRYPDLSVHRMLGKYTAGKKISQEEFMSLKKIAEETSEKEIKAMQAERDSIKYKQVEYMLKHINEEFTGVISGISDKGIFVAENNTGSEGLIRLRNIKDDYYTLDESGYSIVGERTGKKFQLGQEIDFKVIGGDLEKKQLDYETVKK